MIEENSSEFPQLLNMSSPKTDQDGIPTPYSRTDALILPHVISNQLLISINNNDLSPMSDIWEISKALAEYSIQFIDATPKDYPYIDEKIYLIVNRNSNKEDLLISIGLVGESYTSISNGMVDAAKYIMQQLDHDGFEDARVGVYFPDSDVVYNLYRTDLPNIEGEERLSGRQITIPYCPNLTYRVSYQRDMNGVVQGFTLKGSEIGDKLIEYGVETTTFVTSGKTVGYMSLTTNHPMAHYIDIIADIPDTEKDRLQCIDVKTLAIANRARGFLYSDKLDNSFALVWDGIELSDADYYTDEPVLSIDPDLNYGQCPKVIHSKVYLDGMAAFYHKEFDPTSKPEDVLNEFVNGLNHLYRKRYADNHTVNPIKLISEHGAFKLENGIFANPGAYADDGKLVVITLLETEIPQSTDILSYLKTGSKIVHLLSRIPK